MLTLIRDFCTVIIKKNYTSTSNLTCSITLTINSDCGNVNNHSGPLSSCLNHPGTSTINLKTTPYPRAP